MNRLLLDTCAAIWLLEGQLTGDARTALRDAAAQGQDAFVSLMTAWEVGQLSSRGRLRLSVPPLAWFEQLLAEPAIALTEPSPKILVGSSFLPGVPPRDPIDRIMIATAREHDFRIVTRDRQLLAYASEGHVKALAC